MRPHPALAPGSLDALRERRLACDHNPWTWGSVSTYRHLNKGQMVSGAATSGTRDSIEELDRWSMIQADRSLPVQFYR